MRRIEKRGAVNVLCDDDGNGCMPATRAEIEFFDEIERLRAENKSIGGEADAWRESAITCQRSASEFARQRDILLLERDSFGQQLIIVRAEVEALKATLTQQCKGFRADVEKLEADAEALRVDAERYRFVRTADGIRISTKAARDPVVYDAAIDAARVAQGGRG